MRGSNEDKRRAVVRALEDQEWMHWSDSEIARICAVNHATVSRIRNELSPAQSASKPRTYTTKHGTVATMNISNIGTKSTITVFSYCEIQRGDRGGVDS